MITITQNRFDELCESLNEMQYKCDGWFPSLEEIKTKLEPHIERDIKFALWILETSKPPQTDAQKEARRYLMNLVNSVLDVV